MPGERKNQSSLTRAVLSRRGAQKQIPISKVIVAAVATVVLLGCKQKETILSGQVFIATSGGQNLRLGDVEVLLVERKQALEFLESKRRTIESAIASRQRELESAEAAAEKARSDHNLFLRNRPYLTNADYISAKADLDGASQEVETLKEAAEKWRTRNAELQAAAYKAVQQLQLAAGNAPQRQTAVRSTIHIPRPSTKDDTFAARYGSIGSLRGFAAAGGVAARASEEYAVLEKTAKMLWSGSGIVPDIRTAPPAGEIRQLAEWRSFLQTADEGLRIIATKTAKKRGEVTSLEVKLKNIEHAAIAENRRGLESAEARVAAAKSRLKGSPTAETYLASFQPAAVRKTHTDADGVFSLAIPHDKEFVVFAKAARAVPLGDRENYYWLVNVPLSRTGRFKLQLSNNNLARTHTDGHLQVLGN